LKFKNGNKNESLGTRNEGPKRSDGHSGTKQGGRKLVVQTDWSKRGKKGGGKELKQKMLGTGKKREKKKKCQRGDLKNCRQEAG